MLNKNNENESKRDLLKLWCRKMKLLRRKDHSMMKMVKIMKTHIKHRTMLLLRVSLFGKILKENNDKSMISQNFNLIKNMYKAKLESSSHSYYSQRSCSYNPKVKSLKFKMNVEKKR
jgi:hypothetical protein